MSEMIERTEALSARERMLRHLKDLEARLQVAERARNEPIAVIGMACRFPGGADDPESFWRMLRDGVDGVSEVPSDRWDIAELYHPDPDAPGKMYTRFGAFLRDVDRFDPAFFGISPREAVTMDPQQRLLLEVTWEALERAGKTAEKLAGSATGVFVGISSHNYSELQVQHIDPSEIDAYFGTGNSASVAPGRLSYLLGLQGPSIAIDTACSSSLVAVHLACQSLALDECSLAIAGGVNLILSPLATIMFCKARMMAADGRCKTFDAAADGYVRGEGCGVVVLKRLSKALADGDPILAVIRGSAVNQDGRSNGLTAPNGPAQEAVIRKAIARAGVLPSEIGYVEAHGTGTPLGDPIEARALGSVLSEGRTGDRVMVGSVKTNMGHLEAAAGMAGLIKTILVLQHGEIPPHLHLNNLNPHISLESLPIRIPTTLTPWPANGGRRIAGLSAFSFSGTNAHIVVEAMSERPCLPEREPLAPQLFALSGRTAQARLDLAQRYRGFLSPEQSGCYSLEEICCTAGVRRAHHEERLSVVADSIEALDRRLADFLARTPNPEVFAGTAVPGRHPNLVFVFSGAEELPEAVLRELKDREPIFRVTLEQCDAIVREVSGRSPIKASQSLTTTLFAQQVALADLWRSWGIEPDAVIGSGVGELAAAYVAKALSLRDALRLAYAPSDVPEKSNIEYLAPSIPIYSAQTGGLIFGAGFELSEWSRGLLKATVASATIHALVESGHDAFLELGVETAFSSAIRESLRIANRQGVALASLRSSQTPRLSMLVTVAQLYCFGLTPDFKPLYPSENRVALLPTYPWQRSPHWIDIHPRRAATTGQAISAKDPISWFYSVKWRERDSARRETASGAFARWLIFIDDSEPAGEAFACRVESEGNACIRVMPALQFERVGESRWTIDPERPEHFRHLLAAILDAGPCTGAAYFWRMANEGPAQAAKLVCGGLLSLIQTLAGSSAEIRPRLWVVTRGTQVVTQALHTADMAQSLLWGLGKVASIEHPEIWGGLVDLDPTVSAEESVLLAEQFAAQGREDLVALRDGRAYVARLSHVSLPPMAEVALREDATYLVTGGLGALGLQIARWMVARGARHLVLFGRHDPSAEAEAALAVLKEAGTRVETITADVSSEADVLRLVKRIDASFPPLRGVVHAAGILDDGILANQTWERFETVLSPKVMGAWNLDRLSRHESLDFFVLFSSAAALLGSAGQGNYAAANSALAALAYDRRRLGFPATCIHWGPWNGGGMASRGDAERWKSRGIDLIDEEDGLTSLDLAVGSGLIELTVLPVSWEVFGRNLPASGVPALLRELVSEPQESGPSARMVSSGGLAIAVEAASPADRRIVLRSYVERELAKVLGMDAGRPIPAQQGFFDIGLDSLTAVELRKRLQDVVGSVHVLPSTLVLDYPTIDALTDFLSRLMLASIAPQPDVLRQRPVILPVSDPIAIIGIGCRFPGGAQDPESFWTMLSNGVDAVTEIPGDRWDVEAFFDADPENAGKMYTRYGSFLPQVDLFDPRFFGISPREALSMDPQQRLLLEVGWEALENAGVAPSRLMGSPTGVFVGVSGNDYGYLTSAGDPAAIDAYFGTGNSYSALAGRFSYVLGLTGPSMAVDTACSSSLVAVHLACRSLRSGESSVALAAGVNLILSPGTNIGLSRARMLAPDGRCKTFDAAADGYVRGEGCGVVVLKRLSDAVRDGDSVLALIRGSAVNQDGRSSGLTVPNGPSQQAVIREALNDANIAPGRISYVEAHGTGTALGDPIELQALAAVMGEGRAPESPLIVGSVKTNIGHLEAAAGIAGLIKVVLALRHQEIPAHLHFHTPTPFVSWDRLPLKISATRVPWPSGTNGSGPRTAGVSSFGFIGTNAHIVLEEAPQPRSAEMSPVRERPVQILALSARSDGALIEVSKRLQGTLQNSSATLMDISFTVNGGRSHFSHRAAVVAASKEEALERLGLLVSGKSGAGIVRGSAVRAPKIAFLFSGQGSQYSGMGRGLYETTPVFREAMDRCDALLRPHMDGKSLLSIIDVPGGLSPLHQTSWTQPALFAIQYSLAQLWQSWGVTPAVVIGHSVGECAAACVAGMFTLEDGLKFVAGRARIMQSLPPGGAMAAVLADEEQVSAAIAQFSKLVSIAAVNGPDNTVISGERSAVQAVMRTMESAGVHTSLLAVSHAFHSPLMDPALDELERIASAIDYLPLRIGMVSSFTGDFLREDPERLPRYWRRHAREPVRFASGMKEVLNHNCDIFIEIGPSPVLLGMSRKCAPAEFGTWLPSLRAGKDDVIQILDSLAHLYVRDCEIDWESFDRGLPRRKVSLPTYPFERQRYWPETRSTRSMQGGSDKSHPFPGRRLRTALDQTIYHSEFSSSEPAFLKDHRIYGTVLAPGAAHIAMVLAAAADTVPGCSCVLEDVAFPEALALKEGQSRAVQLILSPGPTGIQFRVASALKGDTEANSWAVHATGRLHILESSVTPAGLAAEPFLSRCTEEVEGADFYSAIALRSIELGTSFRRVEHLRRRDGEAICRMRWSEADKVVSSPLHPGLVDACFQLVSAALPHNESDSTAYVPFAVDRFKLHSSHSVGEPLWCHAAVRSESGSGHDSFAADIVLFSESGRAVAEIEGLSIRRAPREAFLRAALGDVNDLLYEVVWRPEEIKVSKSIAAYAWLVFADGKGVGDAVGRILSSLGSHVVMVRPGISFVRSSNDEFRIDPENADHFKRLYSEAIPTGQAQHVGVIHLWSLDLPSPESISAGSMIPHCVGLRSAVHLVQSLSTFDSPPRLWLVTRGATDVVQSPLHGLGTVVALEHPELHCIRVDLDPRMLPVESGALLFKEIQADDGEDQVRYWESKRLAPRLVNANLRVGLKQAGIVPDGSYLITGGLGGIGLLVADWLVEKGARNVILMGRSEPSPEAQERIGAMEKKGANILAIRGDVCKTEDVARVLRDSAALMPPLRGIFHSAAILDDGTLVQQTWDRFASVLGPKVEGAWNLHTLSRDLPLDHFVLFSSVASILGSPGQANYAAANSFLDALAYHRRTAGLAAVTINWGAWSDIGIAARRQIGDRLRTQAMGTISPDQGLHVLDQILSGSLPQVVVMPVQWDALTRMESIVAKLPILSELVRESARRDVKERPALPDLKQLLNQARPADRRVVLRNNVMALAMKILGLGPSESLDLRQPLNEIGLDSLMAIEIRNALGIATGRLFPSTLLFNYPTVAAITDFIASEVFGLDVPARDMSPAIKQTSDDSNQLDGLSQSELVALLEQELQSIDEKREIS